MSHWLPSSEPKSPFNINISSHQNVTIWKTRGEKETDCVWLEGWASRQQSPPCPPRPSLQHISITTRVNLLVVDYSLNKCNGLILLLTLRLKVRIHTAIVRLWRQKNPQKIAEFFFSFCPIHAKISTENRAGKVGSCRTLWKYSLNWRFGLISTRRCEQTRLKVQLDKDRQWKQLLMLMNHTLLSSEVFSFSATQCFVTGQGI